MFDIPVPEPRVPMGEEEAEGLLRTNAHYAAAYAKKPYDFRTQLILRDTVNYEHPGDDGFNLPEECDPITRKMLDRVYELAKADKDAATSAQEKKENGVVRVETVIPTPHGFVFKEIQQYIGKVEPDSFINFCVDLVPVPHE